MRKDPKISDVFYFFKQHTTLATGRTVGRKIGVVQEIILKKHLCSSQRIRDCLLVESQVLGKSGAQHKVEFVLCQPKIVYDLPVGTAWKTQELGEVEVITVDPKRQVARLAFSTRNGRTRVSVKVDGPIPNKKIRKDLSDAGMLLKLAAVTEKRVRLSVLQSQKVRCTVESKRVGAQRFSSSESLGPGIQTIEKAKQASLVAIDCSLQYNNSILPQRKRGSPNFISTVILGNGVHWKKKDLSILATYVDYTYLIPDSSIIRYAKYVMDQAGKGTDPIAHFMSYFSGLMRTVSDGFLVSASDFAAIEPKGAPPIANVLEAHIGRYPVRVF